VGILENLRSRRTYKMIGNTSQPISSSSTANSMIDTILENAGNAPFHHGCDRLHKSSLTSSVPWRAYKLDPFATNRLMDFLIQSGDVTKVPNMLAAAEYLVQVTWLPDEGTLENRNAGKDKAAFSGTLRNMEHIAAASAFVQSLLLAGEEKGFRTYWSSGGALKSASVFDYLGIPDTQLLLGSIFLFPSQVENAEVKPGAMRDARGSVQDWSVWCEIP